MEYMTIQEASEKWGITSRRIQVLCAGGRVENACTAASILSEYDPLWMEFLFIRIENGFINTFCPIAL